MLIVIYSTNRSSTESSAMFFFFSSRRRHTRYWRDWSSDVCSSDLNSIRACNILMIPGGFSAGDEPDGSAKFIATAFRNPKIEEAVMKLLNQRDGLMIGICNGFQALIKLGLVPYGQIKTPSADRKSVV